MQEILSQPEVWLAAQEEIATSADFAKIVSETKSHTEWLFLGCGTSFYLAEAAAASWTLLTGQRARALPASEPLLFKNLTLHNAPNLQTVIISRSGRTSEAVRVAKLLKNELRVPTLGITCATESQLENACDFTILVSPADEKSTVMTRSFTSMLLALQLLACRISGNKAYPLSLNAAANHFSKLIHPLAEKIEQFAAKHSFEDYVFLGQGPFIAVAREASLKVTEMSCSYGQFFHTLEFRHGPKAIVSPKTCLTFFLSESGYEAESEVLVEMKELGGVIFTICNHANETVRRASDFVFELGLDGPELALLTPFIAPAQLLGAYTGIKKGLDPDNPRNLSRVVILD